MAIRTAGTAVPQFEDLMRSSGRDLSISRPVLALMRAEELVGRALEEALASTGLTPAKFNVLMELASAPDGRLALCEIGRRLVRSAPNITGLIDRLEADRLVRRGRDARDRRLVIAEITARGWEALRPAAPAVFDAERRAIGSLSASDRRTLTTLLRALGESEAAAGRSRT